MVIITDPGCGIFAFDEIDKHSLARPYRKLMHYLDQFYSSQFEPAKSRTGLQLAKQTNKDLLFARLLK